MPVERFENFLPKEILKECVDTARDILNRPSNELCTNRFWSPDIRKDSFPVLIHNIYKTSKLHEKLKNIIEEKTERNVFENNIMIYFWTRYSYIPWHNDYTYDGAITIYLNPDWDKDFGGYFIYEDENEELKAVIPKENMGLMQYGSVQHCTTPVNFQGDLRVTIQAFLQDREENKKIKIRSK